MNNKGQVILLGLMLGTIIIVLALSLAGALREQTEIARNITTTNSLGLDCTNSSISQYDKITCLTTDLTLPYFIGILIFLGGGIITARIIFNRT